MEAIKVIVAMVNINLISKVKSVLQAEGYNVVDTALDGSECLRKARMLKIDLAVIDFDISSINGRKVSNILIEDGICDVVLIVNDMQKDLLLGLGARDEISILTKPLNKGLLLNTLEIMSKSIRRAQHLKQEISSLKDSIEVRKVVEKAKGLIMKLFKVDEEEAFRIIQKESMKTRKSMKEVAYSILEKYK